MYIGVPVIEPNRVSACGDGRCVGDRFRDRRVRRRSVRLEVGRQSGRQPRRIGDLPKLHQTEIEDLDREATAPVRFEPDVLRLEIAVHDSLGVRVVER